MKQICKKQWIRILAVCMVLYLAGCGGQKGTVSQAAAATVAPAQTTEAGTQQGSPVIEAGKSREETERTGQQEAPAEPAGESREGQAEAAGTTQEALAETAGNAQEASAETAGSAQEASAEAAGASQEAAAEPAANPQGTQESGNGNSDTAVVYFSGTGNTKAVAETMARILEAPVYEIVPEVPYTSSDLNYRDDGCRANREMEDAAARPAIASDLSQVEGCKRLYIGYPIWWGTAPRIIQTFLESRSLEGVEIYTFCTSGGSGVDQSVKDLQELYPGLNIISGHRFSSGAPEDAVREWLAGL